MFRKQLDFFQDPHISYPTTYASFEEYKKQCRTLIEHHRKDLISSSREKIVDANTPFELRPAAATKQGVLLIHGLLDCPFMLKDIALSLQSELLVRSILLPGHGTVPGALLNIKKEDWIRTVKENIAQLKKEVEKIILIGFSTGGTLALHHALHDEMISGICLIAPALKINSHIDFASNWYQMISPFWPRAAWLNCTKEMDYTKYQSICFNSVYEVYTLAKKTLEIAETRPLHCPQWIAIPNADHTIRSKKTLDYFKTHTKEKDQCLIYARPSFSEKNKKITIRSTIYPELNVKDFSHVNLPIAPDNIHYGKKGDYPENKTHPILMYNPDFDFFIQHMKEFIFSVF